MLVVGFLSPHTEVPALNYKEVLLRSKALEVVCKLPQTKRKEKRMSTTVIDKAKKVPAAAGSVGQIMIGLVPAKKPSRRERIIKRSKKAGMFIVPFLALVGAAKVAMGRKRFIADDTAK